MRIMKNTDTLLTDYKREKAEDRKAAAKKPAKKEKDESDKSSGADSGQK